MVRALLGVLLGEKIAAKEPLPLPLTWAERRELGLANLLSVARGEVM